MLLVSVTGLAYSPDKIQKNPLRWIKLALIGEKLDKSGENWRKLILTIEGERKGQVHWWI